MAGAKGSNIGGVLPAPVEGVKDSTGARPRHVPAPVPSPRRPAGVSPHMGKRPVSDSRALPGYHRTEAARRPGTRRRGGKGMSEAVTIRERFTALPLETFEGGEVVLAAFEGLEPLAGPRG